MSYICEKCHKTFTESRYLKQHKNKRIPCDREHICNKCGMIFTTAYNLRKHKNRKTPCAPDEVPVISDQNTENRCHYCNKTFASNSNLKRHQRNCNALKDPNIINRLLDIIESQKRQLDEKPPTSVTNNNITSINNVVVQNLYVNVTICDFGHEDLTKLDPQEVIKLIKSNAKDFIPRMIEHVHANPKYPEYHNVFYDPGREKAIVFVRIDKDKKTWKVKNLEDISNALTVKIKDHVKPGAGPYYDILAGKKDYDGANAVIDISNKKWDIPEILEETKNVLTKVTKNKGFLEQVEVLE